MKKTIYIGITGNRDISIEQSVSINKSIKDLLKFFLEDESIEVIIILTPLADSVDRIIANVVLNSFYNMKRLIPLPFSENLYKNTFGKGLKINNISQEDSIKVYEDFSIEDYYKTLSTCDDIYIELQFDKENYLNKNIDEQSEIRNEQYALFRF